MIKRVHFKKTKSNDYEFEIFRLEVFFKIRTKEQLQKRRRLDFYNVFVITGGHLKHEIDFTTYDCTVGDIIMISKNQVHLYYPNNNVTGYLLFFTEDFIYQHSSSYLQEIVKPFNHLYFNPIIKAENAKKNIIPKLLEQLLEVLYTTHHSCDKSIKSELVHSELYSIMIFIQNVLKMLLIVDNITLYSQFCELKNLIEINYKDKKLVQDYAEMMYLSKKSINQITRTVIDESAKQFINQYIILEIKRYLSDGRYPINEISELTGFKDASYMTRFFKRYVGYSPKEFKQSIL